MARAAWIQLGSDPRLEKMARRQFQSKVLIRPRRGLILDRNGEPLAANMELNSLAANPLKIRNRKTLARLISKATEIPYTKILQRLEDKKEFVWIKRHLTDHEMARLKKWRIIDADGDLAAGLWLVKESKRVYPHGELAAHSLGSVNVDSDGLEGVELWQNEKLRGKVISVNAIKDAFGRPAFIDSVAAKNVQEGRDGESVSLTLDASLQFAVEEELRNAVRKANAKSGTVIVMNAVNGEILALANQPAFNPNEKGVPADRRRNRGLTDGYEPGSTMKAVLLAGALSHGSRLTDQVYGENGTFVIQGKRISEAEAHEKFKWISLKKMIQVSSNVGAAKLALKLGADHFHGTLRAMGFGEKSGTTFPGEISGRVPARKTWQPLTLANIGFGHGVLVTPIQMLRAYASFANGGWLVQPTLLKAGEKAEPPKRVLTQKVSEQVTEALASVAEEGGTGLKANVEGYRVAGKTGTAQKVDPATGGYSRSKYIASFIGYAVDVDPKIVIFTMIDEPRGVYYASETAAPLFAEVLTAVGNRFSLPTRGNVAPKLLAKASAKGRGPSPGPVSSALPMPVMEALDVPVEAADTAALDSIADRLRASQAQAIRIAHPGAPAQPEPETAPLKLHGAAAAGKYLWKMPDLRGLTPREAIQVLKGHKFHVELQGSGVIHSQSPEAGKVITEGETIRMMLSE